MCTAATGTVKEAFETALETIRAGSQQHGLGPAESDKFTLLPATPGYNHDVHAFGEHGLPLKGAYINETRPLCPLVRLKLMLNLTALSFCCLIALFQ
jgi:hypothetical protein